MNQVISELLYFLGDSFLNQKHDIAQYIEEINLALQQDYLQIRSRVKQDPGTAGDQTEETWAGILRKWLPSHYHVVTKGRILGTNRQASPQIDILILWPSYPPFLLKKKLYMASGVAAAFECKLTFKLTHLKDLFETAKILTDITNNEYCQRKTKLKERRVITLTKNIIGFLTMAFWLIHFMMGSRNLLKSLYLTESLN